MATWLNHVAIAAPRNATTTHTVDPSSVTGVVGGTAFTPTAGRLLVVCVEGAVTSTTPTGWTLPTGGSAVSATGLYVWTRTAAGSDTFTTTHNAANYPMAVDFYEYAATSTFVSAVSATGVANGGAGPTLTGLTGTNWIAGVVGQDIASTSVTGSVTWSTGVKASDFSVAASGTDGYTFSLTYLEDSALTSASAAATSTVGNAAERLMFAVKVAATATATPFRRPQIIRQAVNRAGSF